MQNISENTYYDTKRLILAKNVNQNESTAQFRAKNPFRLSFSSPLYGSTPVIQDENLCPNWKGTQFCLFGAFSEFQMGHTVYQIEAKTPRILKIGIKNILNTWDFRILSQKPKTNTREFPLVEQIS